MNSPLQPTGNPFVARAKGVEVTPRKAPPRKGPKAAMNFFPSDSELSHMIDRALEALSKGIFWDRGAILNLLV
jgi:hypothetical protein